MNLYTAPDHMLDDIDADARDARELEQEAARAAAWDDMLSDDGDISEVLELLTEHPMEVLNLLRDYHHGNDLRTAAYELAARLHELADGVVEERVA
nr:hypothetical protein [uncultured Halomonas sp.]